MKYPITTFPKYNEFLAKVVAWNTAAGNVNFTTEQLALQRKVTLEELKETLQASKENDYKELIDGVIDVFVTAGFLGYLLDPNGGLGEDEEEIDLAEAFPYSEVKQAFDQVLSIYVEKMEQNDLERYFHEDILFMIIYVTNLIEEQNPGCGLDLMEDYFQDVIDSNNSKFIGVADYEENEEAILAYANEQYKDKFENIRAVPAILDGQPVYVLRADYGSGKILKPQSYKAPAFNS